MKNIVSYSLVCIFIIGCSQSNSKSGSNKTSNIQIIDIDNGLKTISRIPIKCSDFIDSVQYINLETNQESLIGGLRGVQIMTTPDFLYGDFKKFSLYDGKYIHSVGKRGRGPGEFTMAIGSATDIINNRVFVLDNWTEELLIYDADNNFIKKIDVVDQVQRIGYLGNENLIFLRDDSFIFYPPFEYQVYNLSEERISYTREI